MNVAEGGGIFISYRRQETSHLAGRLYDRLTDRFGEDHTFIDVDALEPGVDFTEAIFRAVAACQVLLAIIGPVWVAVTDDQGGRRLDDPDDIVRLEIEAALARGVRVIPILVEGAVMPARQDLPSSLSGLTRRHALPIKHESFRYDAGRLVTTIEPILAPASGSAAVPGDPDAYGVRPAVKADDKVAQEGAGSSRNDLVAARLLTDVEYAANSITDEQSKARALVNVAWALAPTDPYRAERIANSITRESSKVAALTSIARAVATTDPARAARLLTDAEHTADSITNESAKASALVEVADLLASTDPTEPYASPTPSPSNRRRHQH